LSPSHRFPAAVERQELNPLRALIAPLPFTHSRWPTDGKPGDGDSGPSKIAPTTIRLPLIGEDRCSWVTLSWKPQWKPGFRYDPGIASARPLRISPRDF